MHNLPVFWSGIKKYLSIFRLHEIGRPMYLCLNKTRMTRYLKFKKLHAQSRPLLIGNVWNVQSAKVFERSGFQAIGTSSAAIAHSLGYEDGWQMPFSTLLFIVERITKSVSLPLSVDLESGYGNSAEEIVNNIIELEKAGIAGINIEDSNIKNGERKLKDHGTFCTLLQEVKRLLNQKGISIFINVRCDVFLLHLPNPLKMAAEKIKCYEQAGADGIFLPCIVQKSNIAAMVSQIKIPLNVMCMPGLPDFETLNKLEVKRISMGSFLNDYVYSSLETMTKNILKEQSFQVLF